MVPEFIVTTLLLLMVTLLTATASEEDSWTNAVKALGLATDSNEYLTITASYGHSFRSHSGKSETLNFEASGITFRSESGRVVEVEFQIAPGKAISDVPYSGKIPKDVMAAKNSPDHAIRMFGPPLNDLVKGYRKLTYLIGEKLMTLYYGPQLDFVKFTNKPTEPNGAADAASPPH